MKLVRMSNECIPCVASKFKSRRFAHEMVIAGLEISGKEAILTITLDYDKVQSRYSNLCAMREKLDPSTWGTSEAEWRYHDAATNQLRHWAPDQLAGRDINNEFNDALVQAAAWAKRNAKTKRITRVNVPEEPVPLTGLP